MFYYLRCIKYFDTRYNKQPLPQIICIKQVAIYYVGQPRPIDAKTDMYGLERGIARALHFSWYMFLVSYF